MAMLTESEAYTMLLRSNAPQTEPFRRWVTEEVLPTIRKTGKYDAEESTNPAVLKPCGNYGFSSGPLKTDLLKLQSRHVRHPSHVVAWTNGLAGCRASGELAKTPTK